MKGGIPLDSALNIFKELRVFHIKHFLCINQTKDINKITIPNPKGFLPKGLT